MKQNKQALAKSLLSLFLCVSMLIGTTFAWFTDSVTSGLNTIAAGNLDVELYHSNAVIDDEKVTPNTKLFLDMNGNPIPWEPGVVSYENLRVSNEGDLALIYQLAINTANENYILDGANRYGLSQILKVGVVEGGITATDRDGVVNSVAANDWTSLSAFLRNGSLQADGEEIWGVVIYWQPGDNDNNWNANNGKQLSSGDALSIDLGVKLTATQEVYENDSFGNDYDIGAKDDVFPAFGGGSASVPVDVVDGLTTAEVTIAIGDITATIPAGVKVNDGVNSLSLSVKTLTSSSANIQLGEGEAMRSLDVHVEGVAADNTTPITVTLPEVAPTGLNLGNYKVYHVEDATNEMTLVAADAAFDAHNQYKYDPATGDVALYMATFSEVVVTAEPAKWEGNFNYDWYDADAKELIIANADQLAAFGAIVGGMKKVTGRVDNKYTYSDEVIQDSFKEQTIKLIADIDLADAEADPNLLFYPIGYYNSEKTYERTNTAIDSSLKTFEGTFDGNGHTIANFYHNTWEMKGDHNWYAPEDQYYRDGMGLFGRVYKGTVKNLTVKNFTSDGEIATTGVIAAYADGATFENIAIVNCNPRVYNIGNGGIVGCVGWYAKEKDLKTTFTNITVDNTNKISALWGSYDVACGGIVGQYYPTSGQSSAGTPKNAGVHFENCHVSAQMDVYNDVCGNYQYYAYRYAGMLIGSVRENVTIDGHVYPDMTGISAEGCTVHFGTWNDYYYCEFEKNGHPSYSGPDDYKFSRVPNNEIDTSNGKENATCIGHNHTAAEDNQAVYLPFNNLVTGYGWGVTTKVVGELTGVTILDIEYADSVDKFEGIANGKEYQSGSTFTIGELFKAAQINDEILAIKNDKVVVTVSPVYGTNSTVSGTYTANTSDWTQGTLTFSGMGQATITIQDYFFCKPATITINVVAAELFETKFNNPNFTYRVGNAANSTVALGSIFASVNDVSDVTIVFETQSGNASGDYTANATWTKGTIQFSGTGKVKVTISAKNVAPLSVLLEVVDATNTTGAANATSNNVVLLNNAGFSSLTVSGGYTLYGNGFTLTCGSDSAALDFGYSFVTLSDGILDNVQIVTPNYDYAALYKDNLTSADNRSQTTDKTRYYNAKSAVTVSGNSQILNSRISGARAAVNVTGGNLIIDNSRIEGGAVANILIGAANSVTLRDITLIQKPMVSTYDASKSLMGFSVLYMCDAEGKAAPTTLEGTLVQQAWVNADDKKYVPSNAQDIVDGVMKETAYIHNINGKDSLNLGFAYMPEEISSSVTKPDNITDNRTNKATVPYEMKDVKITINILSTTVYVYSYKNTNGTDDAFKTESAYDPNQYGDIITVNYSDTSDGLESGKSFGTDGWVYELNVDLDKASGYQLDFSKLSMSINGVSVTDYKVDGAAKPSPVVVNAGGVTYTLTATVDGKEYTAYYKVTGTETSKESPSKISGPTTAGFGVAKSYGGDWSGAADVLTGVKIKYWSVAENKYVEFDFSNFTVPGNAGKLNGTNSYWEYTHTNNDFTLKVTNTVAIHSGKSVYGMPIRGTDGKLYFTISSTNGYVGSGTTSRAVTMQYEFTDNNGGEKLTFTHTFNISYDKDNQYSYSDLSGSGTLTKLTSGSGGSGGGTCLAEGTLITLADGSKTAIENLRKGDYVMSFDHLTGKVTNNKVIIVVKTQSDFYKNTFVFDDGTQLVTINEHGIYDLDLQKYVNIDHENYAEYIGHRFVSVDTKGNIGTKKLVNVVSEWTTGYKYDIVTDQTLNYVAEDTLSVTHVLVDVINSFDFDENMMYDQSKMQADIEKYGLYTYDEWAEYCDISVFEEYNIPVMKVGISKGLYTKDYIISLINTYVLDESVQII